jgi:hypothetical protein
MTGNQRLTIHDDGASIDVIFTEASVEQRTQCNKLAFAAFRGALSEEAYA